MPRSASSGRLHENGRYMLMNALSVDVEEYFHAAIFRMATCRHGCASFESRVEASVDRMLALLSDHQARATFFILGEVAAAHPALIRRICGERHEVACHGYRHEDVHRLTPQAFRNDVHRAKAGLEDLVSDAVIGYRAPNFSIGRAQYWAYEILIEEGFLYDSSTYPIVHDRYGRPGAPRFPYEIWRTRSGRLTEFPIGTARLFGINLPVGGGGYFRLSPFELVRRGIARVNTCEHQPVMFYVHPWELDPDQPRPPMAWRHRIRHYIGVEKEAAKLSRLLSEFRFAAARDVLQLQGWLNRLFESALACVPDCQRGVST
jgi:polysaccharide deacetylase family protein (PEP-CTERM system associated)